MPSNNQSTPAPEVERGSQAEGNPPQIADLEALRYNGPEFKNNQANSYVPRGNQFRPNKGPTEQEVSQEEALHLSPQTEEESDTFFDRQATIPDHYAIPNDATPSQVFPRPNPLFDNLEERQELAHEWPPPMNRTALPLVPYEGGVNQDQVRFAQNDTPPTMREEVFDRVSTADSRPDLSNQSVRSIEI